MNSYFRISDPTALVGRNRRIALAAVAARLADPLSKLAISRLLSEGTASSSLGALLGLGEVSGNEVPAMLDWLLERQPWIERSLANRRLAEGALILYDLSSSYVEGRGIGMAARGHNRDGRSDKKQITYGLLCNREECPVAIEAFEGKDRVCGARRRSHGASATPSAASRSPSTSRSDAKTTISLGAAARTGSTAKRSSTDSGSSAPAPCCACSPATPNGT